MTNQGGRINSTVADLPQKSFDKDRRRLHSRDLDPFPVPPHYEKIVSPSGSVVISK